MYVRLLMERVACADKQPVLKVGDKVKITRRNGERTEFCKFLVMYVMMCVDIWNRLAGAIDWHQGELGARRAKIAGRVKSSLSSQIHPK